MVWWMVVSKNDKRLGTFSANTALALRRPAHGPCCAPGPRGNLLDLVDDGVGDDLGLGEKLGALHHAVADGRDLALVLHDGALAAGHHFKRPS
jgi:hypothetical protein